MVETVDASGEDDVSDNTMTKHVTKNPVNVGSVLPRRRHVDYQ